MYQWNDERIKRHYDRTLEYAKRDRYNFTDEELKKAVKDNFVNEDLVEWLDVMNNLETLHPSDY